MCKLLPSLRAAYIYARELYFPTLSDRFQDEILDMNCLTDKQIKNQLYLATFLGPGRRNLAYSLRKRKPAAFS